MNLQTDGSVVVPSHYSIKQLAQLGPIGLSEGTCGPEVDSEGGAHAAGAAPTVRLLVC